MGNRAATMACLAAMAALGVGQVPQGGFLKLGGFRCLDLKPFVNDHYLDLYQTGFWSNASFRMDVWKRMGVPYWYPEGQGNIRVAGKDWRWPSSDVVSAARFGGVAQADVQQEGNGAIRFANDGDPYTYWYAGDRHPSGKLQIDFKAPQRVNEVRFLGWATPRHAPRDYEIGLILPGGARKPLRSVNNETRMGEWIAFPAGGIEAAGVYLDVARTMEGEHGPVIYELQARGEVQEAAKGCASEVVLPLKGQTAEEVCFLGNVGGGFDATPDKETPVGEYVFVYQGGQEERVPLVAGRNVASTRYGHFVPEAEYAWGFCDREGLMTPGAGKLYYHLGELAEVEPKRQLMVFSHALAHRDWPLREVRFRCTKNDAYLVLQGVTLRQSGPRMSALVYNGRQLKPTPRGAPKAAPSWLDAQRDPKRTIRLDGVWEYKTDPGDQGIRQEWYLARAARDTDGRAVHATTNPTTWATMPVPSQWYVQGVDYHGVVWFRRNFDVPATFPGKVLVLDFQRVDYDARIWVNGIFVGRHKGAYSSFKLDVTKAIRKGQSNLIVVRVDSPLDPGFAGYKTLVKGNAMDDIAMPYAEEGSMGGIYRSVFLTGRGDATVAEVWASSVVEQRLRSAKVTVRATVSGQGPLLVKCRLAEPAGEGARVFEAQQASAGGPIAFVFDIAKPLLWWPWEQGAANLHTLEVEVWRGDELLDRQVSRVGIKEVEHNAKENCLYVNHHRIFLKGGLNDDLHWQSMMDRTAYQYRIQMQKDANLNVIRLTTHESSPEFYDLADEMGMMVWQENPLQWSYSSSAGVREDIRRLVTETVTQTRPHACVIGYSAWNEGGQYGFTDEITKLIGTLDPTRPMTRASGGGDWDVHVYPTQWRSLCRRTPLWSGLSFGFISETGAYGISDLKNLKAMFGEDLFRYDGAEYFWETFASYRHIDGPAYMEDPSPIEWPTAKIKDYVTQRVDASERFFWQVMKSMYEVTRAQRFAPTTSCIYCRFDDPFPTAFLGILNFVGQPLKAYYGVQQACQQVLPILMFDPQGASDLRVVNEYWFKSWKGCLLRYVLRSYDGTVVRQVEKRFDLPADSTVPVLTRQEIGDLWHVAGGIKADLVVIDAEGKPLSKNTYDLNQEEVHTFVTCVYPVAPVKPLDAWVVFAEDASGGTKMATKGAYGGSVVALEGESSSLRAVLDVPEDGDYRVRIACDSGAVAHRYELLVDGKVAALESFLWLNMSEHISRATYSDHGLAWFPGWDASVVRGRHTLELRWPSGTPVPRLLVDALAMQNK